MKVITAMFIALSENIKATQQSPIGSGKVLKYPLKNKRLTFKALNSLYSWMISMDLIIVFNFSQNSSKLSF